MKNSQNISQPSNGFIKIPFTLAARTDISWNEKAMLSYMFTRSNIKRRNGQEWTLSVLDVVKNTGVPKKSAYRYFEHLERVGALIPAGQMTSNYRPFNIYKISKEALKSEMKPQSDLVSDAGGLVSGETKLSVRGNYASCQGAPIEEDKTIKEDKVQEEGEEERDVPVEDWKDAEVKRLLKNCPRKDRYPDDHVKFMNNLSQDFGVNHLDLLSMYARMI